MLMVCVFDAAEVLFIGGSDVLARGSQLYSRS